MSLPRLLPGHKTVSPQTSLRRDELAALVAQVQEGNRVAQRTFLSTLLPTLLRVVRRVLGASHPELEEVTYQAAHAVLEALPRFRGESTVLHFAYRVAVLTAMNVRRRDAASKRDSEFSSADVDSLAGLARDPEEQAWVSSLTSSVRQLVAELSPELAEALTLHVILGYTVSEIAQVCGAPKETVRSRLRLAKQALRKRVLGNSRLREVVEVE